MQGVLCKRSREHSEKDFVAHMMERQPPATMHNDSVRVETATGLSRDALKLPPFSTDMGIKLCRGAA